MAITHYVPPASPIYLKHHGTLENAQQMANHSSLRTTKLYDRRNDELTLDEYTKVGFEPEF